jgi:hypothetical protein
MANTITLVATHRISPKTAHVGMIRLSIATTDTYATASGGFTVDLTAPLADLKIAAPDIIFMTGTTATNHAIKGTAVAGGNTFTVRLLNGITEIADGALTQTLSMVLFYSQGATS